MLEGLNSEGTALNLNANRQRSAQGLGRSPLFTPGAMPLMYGGIRHTRYNNSSLAASRAKKISLVGHRPRTDVPKALADGLAPHGVAPFSPLVVSLNFSKPQVWGANTGLRASALGSVKPTNGGVARPPLFALRPRKVRPGKRKELTQAILQTRYKPGLSKA